MKTVYLAGKMRGVPLYNFPLFDEAAADLRNRGYCVISPAELDREHGFDPVTLPAGWDWNSLPDHFSLDDAIQRDLDAVRLVDELCLLPGWQASKGVAAEKAVAEWRGIRVWEWKPEGVLQEAARITSGDRQAQYGPPDQDFRRTAGMWSELFCHKMKEPFTAEDVAQAMILLKLSRLQHSRKRDSVVDVAGYARCLDVCYVASGGYQH